MNKFIFYTVLLLIFGLVSCNKVVYYAYEDPQGYYTFEVHKKKVIYRAASSKYGNTIPDFSFSYIYMDSYGLDERNKPTEFYFRPSVLRTLYIHDVNEYGVVVMDNIGTAYVRPKNTPTVEYIQGTTKNEVRLLTNPKGILFTFGNGEVKVNWMPPRLNRVKKIDYEKLQRGDSSFDYENP